MSCLFSGKSCLGYCIFESANSRFLYTSRDTVRSSLQPSVRQKSPPTSQPFSGPVRAPCCGPATGRDGSTRRVTLGPYDRERRRWLQVQPGCCSYVRWRGTSIMVSLCFKTPYYGQPAGKGAPSPCQQHLVPCVCTFRPATPLRPRTWPTALWSPESCEVNTKRKLRGGT